jgi:hypothetical protein
MTALTETSGRGLPRSGDEGQNLRPAKNRVQFDLPPRSMERLNALKLKTEATSYVEVIKNALRLYEALIDDVDKGREILAKDENGIISPYRFFL